MSTDYINNRVSDQINWLNKKSKWNQHCYKRIKIIEILAAASIPLLVGYGDKVTLLPVIAGVLGVLIVVLGGLQQLYKFHDNWIQYRITCEALIREKLLFENNVPPYQGDDASIVFIQRAETIMARENQLWLTNMQKMPDTKRESLVKGK